jgi:hypothetical protein
LDLIKQAAKKLHELTVISSIARYFGFALLICFFVVIFTVAGKAFNWGHDSVGHWWRCLCEYRR